MPWAAVPRMAADLDGAALTCKPIGVNTVSGPLTGVTGAGLVTGTVVPLVVAVTVGTRLVAVDAAVAEAPWPPLPETLGTSGKAKATAMMTVGTLMGRPYRRRRGRAPRGNRRLPGQ